MGFVLNTAGPTTIFNSSSPGAGNWYRVHPRLRSFAVQIIHTASGVAGTTVGSTTLIQGSNDGVNPLLTTGGSSVDALAFGVISGGSPQSNGFTFTANWSYIRANLQSISTGIVQVLVSAGQAG